MSFKVSFRKTIFRQLTTIGLALCFLPSIVLAGIDTHNSDATINSGTTDNDRQKPNVDNITLTNNGTISTSSSTAVQTTSSKSGITIINNAGATIENTGANNDYAVKGQLQTDLTITNSGTIESVRKYAIEISQSTGTTITNNAGGVMNAGRETVYGSHSNTSNTTITNSGSIYVTGSKPAINFTQASGTTITNNAGGEIYRSSSVSDTNTAINLGADSSITNSGQIRADDGTDKQAIKMNGDNSTFTNNSGGSVTGYIQNDGQQGITSTNYGTLTSSFSNGTIGDGSGSSGSIITNHAGGVITNTGTGDTVLLLSGGTLTNSGTIQNTNSTSNNAIRLDADNNTVMLKDEGKVIGLITADAGTTGNKLQFDHGFGRTYFYETSGDFTLEDLSGNTVVKGSAGSVGQGAQESIDERLGLRTYNLRSALKRYSAFPKDLIEDELYVEPFSYYSERGSNSSILSYENYGYGLNLIYPLKSKEFDLILTIEKSKLELQGDHDITNTNFLAGFNARDFLSLGAWKTSGFFVAGYGLHDGKRRILTNSTSSGELDVTSDYTSYEVITGINANYIYSSGINTWNTEIGLTSGYSLTPDYEESRYFTWEARQIWQGSIHIGESLTSKVSDNLTVTVGGELEHRTLIRGREQTYAINGTTVSTRHGQFWQNSVAGKLGANYSINNNVVAYVNLDSRFSTLARGTYGATAGLKLNF